MVKITEIDKPAASAPPPAKPAQTPAASAVPQSHDLPALLENVKALMPDAETKAAIEVGLQKYYKDPPLKGVEMNLKKNVTLAEVQQMIFWPTLDDICKYPQLIANAAEGSPADNPQHQVQNVFMALLYMVHSKDWRLARQFILAGGLGALVELFAVENLYLRGQAIDTFLQLTAPTDFDWWKDLDGPDADDSVRYEMYKLAWSNMIKNLVANIDSSFPNGSFFCLQIFAFWASWVRRYYCKDNVLRLSTELLSVLKRWSEKPCTVPEEHELAEKLYADFSRFPAADDKAAGPAHAQQALPVAPSPKAPVVTETDLKQPAAATAATTATTAAAAAEPAVPMEKVKTPAEQAEAHRLNGNTAFGKGQWALAVDLYTKSLDLDPTSAAYCNRAAALCKRAQGDDVANAVKDSDKAITLDPRNAKAYFRKASALKMLNKVREALDAANRARVLQPDNEQVTEMIKQLQIARKALDAEEKGIARQASQPQPQPQQVRSSQPVSHHTSFEDITALDALLNSAVPEPEAFQQRRKREQQQQQQQGGSVSIPITIAEKAAEPTDATEEIDPIQRLLNAPPKKKPLIQEL
eukprot:TRINITY_DN6340_c0_g1_i1.p1 TRINITY_DN6340_c0_g1~~TRINITY_DN6340_c0_g1_i1.p1  ORF type:complete len:582 (-),score=195.83 TRINITY_DN6340_c0_g1_i1:1038-2783(-)